MNKQKFIALMMVLFFAGCSENSTVVKTQNPVSGPDAYKEFLRVCEEDMRTAVRIIGEKELVKTLTHLQRMDTGGTRYYPLERESISETIRSVTKYQYNDCYLINKNGTFIYTMADNTYFAKKITTYVNTPLARCFSTISAGSDVLHIEDIMAYPPLEGEALYMSLPVHENGKTVGVFIVRVELTRLQQICAVNR